MGLGPMPGVLEKKRSGESRRCRAAEHRHAADGVTRRRQCPASVRSRVKIMYKIVIPILVSGVVVSAWPHPAMGLVAQDEDKTSSSVTLVAAALATVDVVTIFGNATALARGERRNVTSSVGIISGVGSIAFGGYVLSAEDDESFGILMGIVGGVSLALGAFGALLSDQTEAYGIQDLRVGPDLTRHRDQTVWGLCLSGRF